MRRGALGCAIVIAWTVPAAAQPPRCPATVEAPRVEVVTAAKTAALDTSKSVRELKVIAPSGLGHRTLGLYRARFSSGAEIVFRTREQAGQACMWITRVRATLGYDERKIHVGREFKPGSCQFKAILDHEKKHAAIDDAVLARHVPRLRKSVAEAASVAGVLGPLRPADLEDGKQRLGRAVESAYRRAFDRFQAEREQAQKTVDSPAEYARIRRQCRGRGGFRIDE